MSLTLTFPVAITEEYRPTSVAQFVGLEKQRRILAKLAANPKPCAMLFCGAPGTGKTSLALAFAKDINAEVHHIGSQECTVDRLKDIARICQYVPLTGGFHVVLVDEADAMSNAAQLYLLSKLDSTEACPNTIWIFTCNAVDRLEERFLSRCLRLPDFNSYGAGKEITALLERVWRDKAGDAPLPKLDRIACGNVRESLQRLEVELLAV